MERVVDSAVRAKGRGVACRRAVLVVEVVVVGVLVVVVVAAVLRVFVCVTWGEILESNPFCGRRGRLGECFRVVCGVFVDHGGVVYCAVVCSPGAPPIFRPSELELELIQTQMTQKLMLRAEMGMRVRCAKQASIE